MGIRVIFLGSPEFAVPTLRALAASDDIDVVLVVSRPDRPAGRGRHLTPPPVARAALELNLALFQPEHLRDAQAVERLRSAAPDLLLVVAYGEILRQPVLELAPHGALNVHPSLLPKYRGAAPIQAAIMAGDQTTGTSIIRLVRALDAGPIVAQRELDIKPNDTAGSLAARLADQAADLVPRVVRDWVAGRITPREQDDAAATYTREWTRDDARIDWSAPAERIGRLVRAANPAPIAWTTFETKPIRVHAAHPVAQPALGAPGSVRIDAGAVLVATGDGALELEIVQPAGKRPMRAQDWLRGLHRDDVVLGS